MPERNDNCGGSRFLPTHVVTFGGWIVAGVMLVVVLRGWQGDDHPPPQDCSGAAPPSGAASTSAAPAPTLMTVYVRPHSDSFSRGRWIRFWRYEKRSDGTVAFAGPDGAMTVDSSAVDWPGVKRAIE